MSDEYSGRIIYFTGNKIQTGPIEESILGLINKLQAPGEDDQLLPEEVSKIKEQVKQTYDRIKLGTGDFELAMGSSITENQLNDIKAAVGKFTSQYDARTLLELTRAYILAIRPGWEWPQP